MQQMAIRSINREQSRSAHVLYERYLALCGIKCFACPVRDATSFQHDLELQRRVREEGPAVDLHAAIIASGDWRTLWNKPREKQ